MAVFTKEHRALTRKLIETVTGFEVIGHLSNDHTLEVVIAAYECCYFLFVIPS